MRPLRTALDLPQRSSQAQLSRPDYLLGVAGSRARSSGPTVGVQAALLLRTQGLVQADAMRVFMILASTPYIHRSKDPYFAISCLFPRL